MPIIVLNVMLIVLGVIAANVQMWRVQLDANASATYWAGAWLVLCLIAYGVVRAIARWAYGYTALAAAVLFVVGINAQAWQSSSTYWMESSVKKSAPLMNALMNGQVVSDAQIRAAKVGIMEPVLLAEAGQSRAMVAASRAFEAEMAALNLDEAFNSESLGSEAGRRTARGKIKASREALREYLATGRDLVARGEGQMREATRKAGLRSDTYINAYLANTTKLRKYFDDLERVAGQMTAERNALLTLLDQNTRHFTLQHSNEAHLVFDDDQVLTAFRARANRIDELGAQAVALDEGLRNGVKQTQTQYNKYVETIK
ncbi:hypothetical protein [Roseateles sp. YR242]|uniref:hypothetical protein n=1 Tax=Roseateles sp. YR242 TaxID=1855305 RepID=UPI000B84D3D6|nr:hypothetical protein [Roseateles sp. YR242]